jgi:hypothetical protein
LRPDVLSKNDPSESTRQQAIADALIVFEAFDPWLDPDKSLDRRQTSWSHLMYKTSELGIFLYSQASTFLFQWTVENPTGDTMRVSISPLLLKVYNEDAQRMESAQVMLSLKSEESYYVGTMSRMAFAEMEKPPAADHKRATNQQAHTIQKNVIPRKVVGTQSKTVAELDGRDAVHDRSPTRSTVAPSAAWAALSELPADWKQAAELETQYNTSRRNSVDVLPKQMPSQHWEHAMGPSPVNTTGEIQPLPRQDWLPSKPPPSAWPSKRPHPPMANGSVLTNKGPDVPMRQFSGGSVRRRSLSFSERSARSSDHPPPEISTGSNKKWSREQPAGPGAGHGGSLSLEISRRNSLRQKAISPESHSKQFENILSKPKHEQMASRPLPRTPSETSRPVIKQEDSQGLEAGNSRGHNEAAAINNGQQMPSTKASKWRKLKATLR